MASYIYDKKYDINITKEEIEEIKKKYFKINIFGIILIRRE